MAWHMTAEQRLPNEQLLLQFQFGALELLWRIHRQLNS